MKLTNELFNDVIAYRMSEPGLWDLVEVLPF